MLAESRRPPQKRKPQDHGTKWGINIGPKGRRLRTVSNHIIDVKDVAMVSNPFCLLSARNQRARIKSKIQSLFQRGAEANSSSLSLHFSQISS
jgi:hypothetical protein